MALPTILVNSATGSDTQASGAGPTTALFGTSDASTDGTGLIVTLTAGTDLSGVLLDGSHVIFLNDTTAGNRNFGKITGSAGSGGATPTVTVANAFGLNLTTKSWAIGGKRASIASTTSKKLFDNNAAAGDAMPGWAVEMQSGHTETIAATLDLRRSGDTTTGVIILRGASGAATMPVVTFSNNGTGIACRGTRQIARDFELRNTNATKTASVAIQSASNSENIWIGLKISHATNKFWKAMLAQATGQNIIVGCEIGNTASDGIAMAGASARFSVLFNYIHDCGGNGITNAAATASLVVYGNIIARNVDGINLSGSSAGAQSFAIMQNTIDANTGDGIEMSKADTDGQWLDLKVINNIISNNGVYGWNTSGLSASAVFQGAIVYGNNWYNNTSGITPLGSFDEFSTTLNPQYVDAANGNFTVGTNLKAKGYPLGGTLNIGYSLSSSYVDQGAVQRSQEVDLGYLPVAP